MELAVRLGVSRPTLRDALAELAVEGIIERRVGSGTFVARRPTAAGWGKRKLARLAVVVKAHVEAGPEWSHLGEMILGILGCAPQLGAECTVLAANVPEEAERIADRRFLRRFDGFISVSIGDRNLLAGLVELGRGPVVLMEYFAVRDLPLISVVDGSFAGTRAVTDHLIDLGHRRIAFLDRYNSEAENPEKRAGFCFALREQGVAADAALIVEPPEDLPMGDAMQGFIDGQVDRLLGLPDPPTALVGFDDGYALPVLRALEARGLTAGRNFSVAGQGDSAVQRGLYFGLTTTRLYRRKMGQEAVRLALSGTLPKEGRVVIVRNRLLVRTSTCPPSPLPDPERG
jgi:DNA-binding LacI/PurR family transcriptional regulator